MNFLERKLNSFQKKSERTKQITLWVSVLIIMGLLSTFWVISLNRNVLKSTQEFNKKAEEETPVNQLVGEKINEFEKLLEEGAVEETPQTEETTEAPTTEGSTESSETTPTETQDSTVTPELSPDQQSELNEMIEEIKEEDNL
jgi:cytoskeletal protein RodZ